MSEPYLEVISFIEQLHRRFLEIVKLELDGLGIRDINNVQAMMLSNIGDAEMTVGELTLRGCYLGSNVSYKCEEAGRKTGTWHTSVLHTTAALSTSNLTEKGRSLRERLGLMHQRHVEMLKETAITQADLEAAIMTLRGLERFWMRRSDVAPRPPQFAA